MALFDKYYFKLLTKKMIESKFELLKYFKIQAKKI
jgi:hypothetical protein